MGFLFNRQLKKNRRIGYGSSVESGISVASPGFTPTPSPGGGTNYTSVGPGSGSIRVDALAADPATLSYLTERNRSVKQINNFGATADLLLTAGGGVGGGAGDLGDGGGAGGGGVVWHPGIAIVGGTTYSHIAGGSNQSSDWGPGTPFIHKALAGGPGGGRSSVTGSPGGNGGGGYSPGGGGGNGLQTVPGSGQPALSATYGYGNPGGSLTGGSANSGVPSIMYGGTPLAPVGTSFGRGVYKSATNISGSGQGGNGSNPPGNSGQTPGYSGSVIVRIYEP